MGAPVHAFELPALESTEVVARPVSEADLRAAREAAHQEATRAGFEAGRQEGQAAVATALEALEAALAQVEALRDEVCAEAESAAVELGLRIAEQALGGALEARPERVVEVVRGALRRLVERERVTLLVNPQDLEIVRDAIGGRDGVVAELGGIEHCDVQAERRVARGGAIVRTQEGEVDATLATKLARAREVLAEELRG